jgi:hypothetical protein
MQSNLFKLPDEIKDFSELVRGTTRTWLPLHFAGVEGHRSAEHVTRTGIKCNRVVCVAARGQTCKSAV